MEDFLFALLSALSELFFEAFFQFACEAIADLMIRSIENFTTGSRVVNPVFAVFGYLLLGVVFGFASVLLFRHPLVHPSRFHGISLIISPLITGFVMSQVGRILRGRGKQELRLETFSYGFTFAFGMALVRFFFVR